MLIQEIRPKPPTYSQSAQFMACVVTVDGLGTYDDAIDKETNGEKTLHPKTKCHSPQWRYCLDEKVIRLFWKSTMGVMPCSGPYTVDRTAKRCASSLVNPEVSLPSGVTTVQLAQKSNIQRNIFSHLNDKSKKRAPVCEPRSPCWQQALPRTGTASLPRGSPMT